MSKIGQMGRGRTLLKWITNPRWNHQKMNRRLFGTHFTYVMCYFCLIPTSLSVLPWNFLEEEPWKQIKGGFTVAFYFQHLNSLKIVSDASLRSKLESLSHLSSFLKCLKLADFLDASFITKKPHRFLKTFTKNY